MDDARLVFLIPAISAPAVAPALEQIAEEAEATADELFLTSCAEMIAHQIDERYLQDDPPSALVMAQRVITDVRDRLMEMATSETLSVDIYPTATSDLCLIVNGPPRYHELFAPWLPRNIRQLDPDESPPKPAAGEEPHTKVLVAPRGELYLEDLHQIWTRLPSDRERIRHLAAEAAVQARLDNEEAQSGDRTARARLIRTFDASTWMKSADGRPHLHAWEDKVRMECDFSLPFPYDSNGNPIEETG